MANSRDWKVAIAGLPIHRLAIASSVILFAGTFFLKVELLVFFAIALLSLCMTVGLAVFGKVDKLFVLVVANYVYWIVSGLSTGGIRPGDFVSPEFFANDGRAFLNYLPLALFLVFRVPKRDLGLLVLLLKVIVVSSSFLFLVWLLTRHPLLSAGRAMNFAGFLSSHTGAGTFYGVITVFLAVYGAEIAKSRYMLFGAFGLLFVFGSASRQAIASLVSVLTWFLFIKRRLKLLLQSALIVIFGAAAMYMATPHTFDRVGAVFSVEIIESIGDEISRFDWAPTPGNELGDTESNIISRAILWAYAAKRGSQSPLLGIGFGRINDFDLGLIGKEGVVYLATKGNNQNNPFNSHNSYLQLFAETGVLGLFLLSSLWLSLYRRFKLLDAKFGEDRVLSAYWLGCRALIIFTAVSALFDNAHAAPSIGFPVLLIIGAGLSHGRHLSLTTTVEDLAARAN